VEYLNNFTGQENMVINLILSVRHEHI